MVCCPRSIHEKAVAALGQAYASYKGDLINVVVDLAKPEYTSRCTPPLPDDCWLSSLRFDQRSCLAFLMELALSRLLSLGCVPNTLALCCSIVEAFSVTAADIPTLRGFDVGANR